MIKLRVFVSSVQKELVDERRTAKTFITSDPFLDEHCVPILYEDEPSMLYPKEQGYLDVLDRCQVLLVIIGSEYGKRYKGLSATHHEYHFAKEKGIPVLPCVRGDSKTSRDTATEDFIKEIRDDRYKYERFDDIKRLQCIILECLKKHIEEAYHIVPSKKETKAALLTVASSSRFDQQRNIVRPDDGISVLIGWGDVVLDIARKLAEKSENELSPILKEDTIKEILLRRGLLWLSPNGKEVFCSTAGALIFAKDPTTAFPQSCIRLLAFNSKKRDPKPADFMDINAPIPQSLDIAVKFIDKNTRHPLRVSGIRRLRLDEYPVDALREALINAMAHRDYEDASRRIHVELFKDRIEISSPGLLPAGVKLSQFHSGKVYPCSRNPILAQSLRLLGLMEEMGTGVLRMRQAMLDHGLKPPEYALTDKCFVVIFRGPGGNLGRLRMPSISDHPSRAVEERLNSRQKKILAEVARHGFVSSGWCRKHLSVAYDTIRRDLIGLMNMGMLESRGKGRSTRYVAKDDMQ